MKGRLFSKNSQLTLVSVLCYALLALSGVLMYVFRDYWKSPVQLFNIATELLCMAIIIVLYRLHLGKKVNKNLDGKYFTALCLVVFIGLWFDVVSWIIDGAVEYIWLNKLVNSLTSICNFAHGALFCKYIFSFLENKTPTIKTLEKIENYLVLALFLVRIGLIIGGKYFTVDSFGHYAAGDLYLLSGVFMPILAFFSCGVAIGAGISIRRFLTLLTYPLSSLIMLGIASLEGDYANFNLSLTLAVILMYCSMFIDVERMNLGLSESFQLYISEETKPLSESFGDKPGGELKHATVLFAQLINFSEKFEAMDPEDAVILLNKFFGDMSIIVENNKGRLLEYPGYGLYCIFEDAPSSRENIANAINASRQIIDAVGIMNDFNRENHYPELSVGIGINTGDLVLGNVGSSTHMAYTALGKEVNLAARAVTYAGSGEVILSSNAVAEYGPDLNCESIGSIMTKGISYAVGLYKLEK